jgi:predicted AAA+ superfamily ATPase
MFSREKYNEIIIDAFETVPIVVLIGSRQVGKTSIMETVELDGKKHFMHGQNPDIAALFQKFSTLTEYIRLNLNDDYSGYLIIDEFQYIQGVSVMLKLLADTYPKLKMLCSGSSSLDILQKVEESLAGRVRVIEVLSLSFDEYLQFTDNGVYLQYKKYTSGTSHEAIDKTILSKLNEYLVYGGMPRAALAKTYKRKIEILSDIYSTYLLRDVRSYIRNEDVVGFNKMLKLLAAQTANLVNTNELSISSGLSYKKTEEYLNLLEQMYIIKLVSPFATNNRKVIGKMKKVFFTDLGLRNMIYNSFNDIDTRIDNGSLFENYVYLELCRRMGSGMIINYYRTNDGAEVDFVINTLMQLVAFEVKFKNINKPMNIKSLNGFISTEDVKKSFIVNRNLNLSEGPIHHIQGYLVGKIEL